MREFKDHVGPDESDNNYSGKNATCKWKPRNVSAMRDFPDAFDYAVPKSAKQHKVREFKDHVNPDESGKGAAADKEVFDLACEDGFIPLETDSVSSESCSSGTRGPDYGIIPRIVNVVTDADEKERCEVESKIEAKTETAKLGGYAELRFRGVRLKEIRCFQMEDGLKIELEVDNLQKESGTSESVVKRVTNEGVKSCEQIPSRRRTVRAVRCFPPGCGPDAALLSDEDLKVAREESKKHMLTCKSCGIDR
ncbi:hypothetical protein L1987_81291 [Smallanthus sonchifolius]|uniref:Uncharacterized protein n=1 Tax=Smallanthus sonchifolius TaxID=185202 RepID=A0ACB8YQ70_9ASTR|nr:hypothetical protein L1987_81291 [Smallanthus sonchifolius]